MKETAEKNVIFMPGINKNPQIDQPSLTDKFLTFYIPIDEKKMLDLLKTSFLYDTLKVSMANTILKKSQEEATASKEEGINMDWQEKYLDKLDRDISDMKASLRATEERVAQMISQTLSEIRDRDNQRHQEFLAINQKIDSINSTIDQKIDSMNSKIDQSNKFIITMAVTTIIGIATMVITVLISK
ncbi:hypothetical protein ciss_06950 [Carboxydothermus islandicus]|uniref:Uncharacterized protein n=1 Tax=Carboxydothermus islandicus TaxID=661089 RepID=A0A1L8D0S4_9THEO|nr:hypothetical protein [Carboxydothermus islandicus]GAV24762.1 hypothetical protein ciss_06950 [Carboxydothermus islandicus]